MSDYTINLITGTIGFFVLASFILGLAYSISTGFAGFMGGLPFWIISVSVLLMAGYDYFNSCVRKKDEN